MRLWIMLLLLLFTSGCVLGQKETIKENSVQTIMVQGVRLTLSESILYVERGGEKQSMALELSAPCFFALDKEKKIAVVKTPSGSALIVGGFFTDNKSSKTDASDDGCRTALRGILITNEKILLSPQIKKVAQCSKGPWDEKMYHIFAHAALKAFQP